MFSTRYYIAMTHETSEIRALLDRVARLSAADAWSDQLNPTQHAALDYLSRANRFSRAPSHVADYLGATRGTVSQTLKALERKGFVEEHRSDTDKRRTSYFVTPNGSGAMSGTDALAAVLDDLPADVLSSLETGLKAVLKGQLTQRGGRGFGMCRTCRHHQNAPDGPYCGLLDLPLTPEEPSQICHEHAA